MKSTDDRGLPGWLFVVFALVTLALGFAARAHDDGLFCSRFECIETPETGPTLTTAPETVTAGEEVDLSWMLPESGMCSLTGPPPGFDDQGNPDAAVPLMLDDSALRGASGLAHQPSESGDYDLFCGALVTSSVTVEAPPPPPELTACTESGPSRIMVELFNRTWAEFFGVPFGQGSSPLDHTMSDNQYITIRELDPDKAVLVSWVSNPDEPFQMRVAVQDCTGAPSEARAFDQPNQPVCYIHSGPPGGAFAIGGTSGCQLDPARQHALVVTYAFANDDPSCTGLCDWDVRTFGAGSKGAGGEACAELKRIDAERAKAGIAERLVDQYPEWCE